VAHFPSIPVTATTSARDARVEQLFDEHASGVFRLARLMIGSADEAEDVVQETFLKLTAHLDAKRPLPNVRGWLYTVAAHACRDRQRGRWRWLPWVAELDRRPAFERADSGDAAAPILVGIRALGRRDRLLIALRAQGLDYREIAAATGIKPASVGRLLARALERVTAAMATRTAGSR
jgi:RNA polymerase sigma-70 factor (ECF subfamily)